MWIADVQHITRAHILATVDLPSALAAHMYYDLLWAQPGSMSPWLHMNLAPGTWLLDPAQGHFEILVWADPQRLIITEGEQDVVRRAPESALYRQWLRQGLEPPPLDVLRHMTTGDYHTQNRRRCLAARDVGVPRVLCRYSHATAMQHFPWQVKRLGTAYQAGALVHGPSYLED